MPTTNNLVDTPFQFWIFLIASLINFLVNISGIVGGSIYLCVMLLAQESAKINQRIEGQEGRTYPEAYQDAIKSELADLVGRQPLGKVVGFLEVELYIYAMIANVPGLIGAVLLFKAFSGWLTTQATDTPEAKSMRTLARFYSYAIGNFLSLLWALLIFEVLRWAMHSFPVLKALLTVQ